ncbi:MAG: hypothetical protein HY744_17110 [Deltaproteobacteria bacterium]|nr:hypothetical protein [Deltaproteobacteria bacterium]
MIRRVVVCRVPLTDAGLPALAGKDSPPEPTAAPARPPPAPRRPEP